MCYIKILNKYNSYKLINNPYINKNDVSLLKERQVTHRVI